MYCHASALLGGLRPTMFADVPVDHQVSDAFNNYVNGVFGLVAVAKWSMDRCGLRTFGADAALDIATDQKDLGKVQQCDGGHDVGNACASVVDAARSD